MKDNERRKKMASTLLEYKHWYLKREAVVKRGMSTDAEESVDNSKVLNQEILPILTKLDRDIRTITLYCQRLEKNVDMSIRELQDWVQKLEKTRAGNKFLEARLLQLQAERRDFLNQVQRVETTRQ